MIKVVKAAFLMGFVAAAPSLFAQDAPADAKDKVKSKESQEITIRKKGDKDFSVTVEVKGDKILVNGKPLAEFKDDNIVINNRKMFIHDGNGNMSFNFDMPGMAFGGDSSWNMFSRREKRALLGVTTEKGDDNDGDGAKIKTITDESGASKAGLKTGDIITKIDGKKIEDPSDLSEYIAEKKSKDEVTVYYKRDGKEKSTKATLGESKETQMYSFNGPGIQKLRGISDEALSNIPQFRSGNWGGGDLADVMSFTRRGKIGLKIQDLDEGNGVKVLGADPESPAEKSGLKQGDVITEINGKKIANTDEAREQLKPEEGKNAYNVKAKRDGKEMSFEIKIPKKLKKADL